MKRFRDRLLKVYMDAAITAINSTLSYFLRKDVMAGVIVVLHPFARDLGFKPHLHLLITECGFDKKKTVHFKDVYSCGSDEEDMAISGTHPVQENSSENPGFH